jgi:organic hydroperoxide reductase OsmC/OhrA
MVANLLGVELEFLEVSVAGHVDVRGTMMVDRSVPVGFLEMRCEVQVRAKHGTDPQLLEKLKAAAEQSCVVLQTLRAPLRVEVKFDNC